MLTVIKLIIMPIEIGRQKINANNQTTKCYDYDNEMCFLFRKRLRHANAKNENMFYPLVMIFGVMFQFQYSIEWISAYNEHEWNANYFMCCVVVSVHLYGGQRSFSHFNVHDIDLAPFLYI